MAEMEPKRPPSLKPLDELETRETRDEDLQPRVANAVRGQLLGALLIRDFLRRRLYGIGANSARSTTSESADLFDGGELA